MKNLSLLAVLAAVALLAGCSTTSSTCGSLHANCCSWDWYQKCDLIEGRVDGNCPVICDEPRCCPGVVATRCYDLPVQSGVVVEEEIIEEVAEGDLPPPDVK